MFFNVPKVSDSLVLRAFRLGGPEAWSALLTLAERNGESRDQLLFEVSCYLLESEICRLRPSRQVHDEHCCVSSSDIVHGL